MLRPIEFQLAGHRFFAEEMFGESPVHNAVAAGALSQERPFCRRHLNRERSTVDPIARFRDILIGSQFDLGEGFDILVVEAREDDPTTDLKNLQLLGEQVLSKADVFVPDAAYLEEIFAPRSPSGVILTPGEVDDLRIGRHLRNQAMFKIWND